MNPYVVEAVCVEATKEASGAGIAAGILGAGALIGGAIALDYAWGKRDARKDFEVGATPNTSRSPFLVNQLGYDSEYKRLREGRLT